MSINIRKATVLDKKRILEISSKIWEGNDYVPYVLDDWLNALNSEFAVLELNGKIEAFGRCLKLLSDYTWLEGLRANPEKQNLGFGKVLTEYFIKKAKNEKAKVIGLSTYIENYASIHIIESYGFKKVASFVYLEALLDDPVRKLGEPSAFVSIVKLDEALEFIKNSEFMKISSGFFPVGWKFYPFKLSKEKPVLPEMKQILGIKKNGKIKAILCQSVPSREEQKFSVDFLEGEEEEMEILIKHALYLARENSSFVIMVPKTEDLEAKSLKIFKNMGFTPWNNFKEDVFVYEKELF